MNDLKLEVGLKINDQQIDQSIKNIQDKLKTLQKVTTQDLSPQAQQQQQGQSRILQDMQKRYLDDLTNRYGQIQKTMEGIDKLYQNSLQSEKARIAAQEKLLELKKQEKSLAESIKTAGGTPPNQPPPAGGQSGQSPQNQPNQLMETFKSLLKSVSVAAIVNGALNITQNIIRAEGRALQAQGTSIGIAAQPFAQGMQGRGYESAFFAQERAEAMQGAYRQTESQRVMDRVQALNPFSGRNFMGMAGGAYAGANIGAGIGAGFGMGFGAIPGAVIGGVVGGAAGLVGASSTNERNRLALFDSENYEKMLTSEGMQDFKAREQAIIASDPFKSMGLRFAQSNQGSYLQTQRSLGLSDSGLLGSEDRPSGFLGQNMAFGGQDPRFGQQTIMRNVQALISSGAQTGDIKGGGLAGLAAAGQQYGISNSSQVLGKISGAGMQQQGTTDDAFYRLMTEAVKSGVNASEMPQELNRFVSVAADLASKGGGFSGSAAELFSAGIGDLSAQGIDAAKGFAEDFMSRSKAGGGIEGQIGYSFLMGDKAKGILGEEAFGAMSKNSKALNALNQLSLQDLERDPALKSSFAKLLNVDEEKLVQLIEEKDVSKQTISESAEEAQKMLGAQVAGRKDIDTALGETSDYARSIVELGATRGAGFLGLTAQQRRAKSLGLARTTVGDDRTAGDFDPQSMLETQRGGAFEAMESQKAVGDQAGISNLTKSREGLSGASNYLELIENSAKKFSENSAIYNEALEMFITATKEGGDALKEYRKELDKIVKVLQDSSPVAPPNPVGAQVGN